MFNVLFEQGSDGSTYLSWLLSGLGWTLALAVFGWAFAFVVGTIVGVGRTSQSPYIARSARVYVEIFRNIPVLVQMFLWYFVLPELLPAQMGSWIKQLSPPWGQFFPALLCLTFYTAARVAEQVRAGLEALPGGQREAAAALGLSSRKTYFLVLVPQALRLIVPSLTSEVMGIYKNSSVALTIGLLELTARSRQISEETFQTFAAFGAATIMYLLLALLAYGLMSLIDQKTKIPGTATAQRKTRGLLARRQPDGAAP
ncbi:MAG: amino acid ABC transporter permease [Pseudolabrys sp.]|jgi:glutamate/aspartate transport system permease protein